MSNTSPAKDSALVVRDGERSIELNLNSGLQDIIDEVSTYPGFNDIESQINFGIVGMEGFFDSYVPETKERIDLLGKTARDLFKTPEEIAMYKFCNIFEVYEYLTSIEIVFTRERRMLPESVHSLLNDLGRYIVNYIEEVVKTTQTDTPEYRAFVDFEDKRSELASQKKRIVNAIQAEYRAIDGFPKDQHSNYDHPLVLEMNEELKRGYGPIDEQIDELRKGYYAVVLPAFLPIIRSQKDTVYNKYVRVPFMREEGLIEDSPKPKRGLLGNMRSRLGI